MTVAIGPCPEEGEKRSHCGDQHTHTHTHTHTPTLWPLPIALQRTAIVGSVHYATMATTQRASGGAPTHTQLHSSCSQKMMSVWIARAPVTEIWRELPQAMQEEGADGEGGGGESGALAAHGLAESTGSSRVSTASASSTRARSWLTLCACVSVGQRGETTVARPTAQSKKSSVSHSSVSLIFVLIWGCEPKSELTLRTFGRGWAVTKPCEDLVPPLCRHRSLPFRNSDARTVHDPFSLHDNSRRWGGDRVERQPSVGSAKDALQVHWCCSMVQH